MDGRHRVEWRVDEDAAVLEMGGSQMLFDFGAPPPRSIDGTWVEISVAADRVSFWRYRIWHHKAGDRAA